MNLSYTRGDKKENVDENYRRIAGIMDCSMNDFLLTHQTHTTNVRVVTEEDRGKGIIKERDYEDVDGLVTNVPGIVLSTFYADCVPLYFVDPVKKAIGLSHSGWRGTVKRIRTKPRKSQPVKATPRMRTEMMTAATGSAADRTLPAMGPTRRMPRI